MAVGVHRAQDWPPHGRGRPAPGGATVAEPLPLPVVGPWLNYAAEMKFI